MAPARACKIVGTMNIWPAIARFLALRRNTSLLLGALVLALTGERLWLGFAPKYLESLGAGVFVIGLFDALQTLLGALYAYPGGWLVNRFGWALGVRWALLVCISLALFTALFQWFMVEPRGSSAETKGAATPARPATFVEVVKSFSPALRELLVSDILIRFCGRI